MRFKRSILIPALLALSAAGSVAAPLALTATTASAAVVATPAHGARPDVFFDG